METLRNQYSGYQSQSVVDIMTHLYDNYRKVEDIDIETNKVKMMKPWDPTKPLANLVKQLEDGRDFTQAEGYTITNREMISKEITLLTNTTLFNQDIRE